ncbi:MAG: phosphate ABC transporter permease subunit PstC [Thermoleophilia bacterium]|nr:phosphate ABC transporter permease subunit PstC [Thermoleophilia bacterium]
MIALSVLVLAMLLFFLVRLIGESRLAFSTMGLGFVTRNDWNVSRDIYGAFPLLAGTLITSFIALLIGVPVAVSSALYLNEMCPRRLRRSLTTMLELLAAVPSVVYGLWGFFVVIPAIRPAEQWFSDTFAFLPFVGGNVAGPNYFTAGLILAIMVIPIISSISREVIASVPREQREAALALGATRWETIKQAVLPPARNGIFSASILGLGRAIGETIAVTIVIGNAPVIGKSLFDQGYTLAAVIANEFGEAASNPLHRSALIAAGLVLLALTVLINLAAQAIVRRAERRAGGIGRRPARA